MPTHPFGKHPTPEEFIRYAKKHGCREAESVRYDIHEGKATNVRTLIGVSGLATSVSPEHEEDEYLLPRRVESLCRRLGIPPYDYD